MAKVRRIVETIVPAVNLGSVLQLAKLAPDRIWLGIAPIGAAATITVSTRSGVTSTTGLSMTAGSGEVPQLKLTRETDPYLVTLDWYGFSAAIPPAAAAWVMEIFEEETGFSRLQTSAGGILLPSSYQSDGVAEGLRNAIENTRKRVANGAGKNNRYNAISAGRLQRSWNNPPEQQEKSHPFRGTD
jgi:hypothetical protein